MADKLAERRRKRRKRIIAILKVSYYRPMIEAIKSGNHDAVQKYATRCTDFKLGVMYADPAGKWQRRMNEAWDEVAKEVGLDG